MSTVRLTAETLDALAEEANSEINAALLGEASPAFADAVARAALPVLASTLRMVATMLRGTPYETGDTLLRCDVCGRTMPLADVRYDAAEGGDLCPACAEDDEEPAP
ncbi:MAG: hypothetical protein AB7E47_02225 [Desulfovibrionaceae bacterium]